jgi:peptidoglycan/LPS O-acetylase OafA/YrhL
VLGLAIAAAGLRAGLALNGVGFERLYYGLDARADSLLVGCALGIALSSNLVSGNRRTFLVGQLKWMSPLSACALLAIAASFGWTSPAMYYWAFFAVAAFACILILDVFFTQTLLVKKVFSNKVLIWIGKLSYGLYLWHYPVYRTMRSQGFDPMAIFWLGTLLTFCVAAASYYFVERPILALKRRFEGTPRSAAGQPPARLRFRVESDRATSSAI